MSDAEIKSAHYNQGARPMIDDTLGAVMLANANRIHDQARQLVLIARMAQLLNLPVGIYEWHNRPGAYMPDEYPAMLIIDLPSGQVSWPLGEYQLSMFGFLGAYRGEWDNHFWSEQYRRLEESGL